MTLKQHIYSHDETRTHHITSNHFFSIADYGAKVTVTVQSPVLYVSARETTNEMQFLKSNVHLKWDFPADSL
jgi:hypothetical protein